jgi:exodeoxyribonuclease VII large subunit
LHQRVLVVLLSATATVNSTEQLHGQLPRYSVSDLNSAISGLLERGFAPRFLLEATVSRPQLKKGHLWMTLVDEQASISGVVWASQVARLSFQPEDGEGVIVVGKLNFWVNRASLCVQVLDLRPSLSSVLRRFERVRMQLAQEGLFDQERKRPLPRIPKRIALATSVPSSALADMLRTAAERWPATSIVVIPIPVQGNVEVQVCAALAQVYRRASELGIETIVLARGGGSREDLSLFDGEAIARQIAASPVPLVCGIGHEDDTTIADLVADQRCATPTAALVSLLPDRRTIQSSLEQLRLYLKQVVELRLQTCRQQLRGLRERLARLHPLDQLKERRSSLVQAQKLLLALSPQQVLNRGFAVVTNSEGHLIRSVDNLKIGMRLSLRFSRGEATVLVEQLSNGQQPPAD